MRAGIPSLLPARCLCPRQLLPSPTTASPPLPVSAQLLVVLGYALVVVILVLWHACLCNVHRISGCIHGWEAYTCIDSGEY